MHTIENFVDSIHKSHLDNAQRIYVANTIGGTQCAEPISPITNFVFEFFLYNSLYAVDWEASDAQGRLIHHDRDGDCTESKMQNALESFCRQRCQAEDSYRLAEAFLPLAGLDDLSGTWTQITPDDRLKAEDGSRFFSKLAELGQRAAENDLQPTRRTFELISACRYFAYGVRNNIFHGSKSLSEIYEPDQARRIGVYDLFLRCLNSLFFLATGRKKHGAAFSQLPIIQRWGTSQIDLTLQQVYSLLKSDLLKPEDTLLHWKLFRSYRDVPTLSATNRRALFYPSAGKDFYFPLLVGLPFCTDFFFYDMKSPDGQSRSDDEQIRLRDQRIRQKRLDAGQKELQVAINELLPKSPCLEIDFAEGRCLEFEFDSVTRRAWIVHEDNAAFLERDIPLSFYFHRGDSGDNGPGEGGSGQRWDSDLLPQLHEKADREIGCRILTDGQPGGLLVDIASQCQKVSLPNSHKKRDYFYGVIR